MQDLDFDELDKAVNSLMPAKPSNSVASVVTPELQPTVPTVVAAPVIKPLPAVRSVDRPATGRFMDVVHPSSDMRTSISIPTRSLPPSTVQNPVVNPTPVKPVIDVPQPQAEKVENWAGLPNYQPPASAPESPFLPMTKVEKRPLGAFSDETPVIQDTSETVKTDEDIKFEDKPKINEDLTKSDKQIPDELDASVLSIEPGSSTSKNDIDKNINPLSYNLASSSINQQYSEQPSSVKNENSSIYDKNTFSNSVGIQSKKKSGWLLVVWILGLIIIGVGAGVAFYLYIMPNMSDFKLPF